MRVFFPKEKQRKFINKILSRISVKEAAKLCKLSERTIRDWRREKFLMDLGALKKLCKKTKILFPKNIEIREHYWYTRKGASVGGIAVWKKYGRIGDPEYRKKRWYEWWEREGKSKIRLYKNNYIFSCKPIQKPNYSEKLAEFVGIVLGDGGITQRQITITLHEKDDREYAKFVVALIKRLFNVPVGTCHRKRDRAVNYIISRTELVRFCVDKLELKQGNKIKQQIGIPNWIKRNKQYRVACVRGLVDTDGCIFTHRYKVNGKWYNYKKLCFTSHSKPLRQSVYYIFKNIGLSPRFAGNRDVRLDSIKDMQKYFQLIGSHNPKHLNKYYK